MAATVIRNAKSMPPHLSTFCGALVGAVIGDCLGAKFEGICYIRAEIILDHFARLESGRNTFYDASLYYRPMSVTLLR